MMLKCRAGTSCPNIAKALILTERDSVIDGEPELIGFPVCADHAPEEAHETASSMNDDEFLIVQLPAFAVGRMQ